MGRSSRTGLASWMQWATNYQHTQTPNMDTTQETAVAVTQPQTPRAPVLVGNNGIIISDFEGLQRFATAVANSGLAPKGIQTVAAISVAIQMGLEVGLTPMAALQNIAVINGRPSLWGDAQLAVARGTGELLEFSEWFEAGGKRLPRNPSTYTDDTVAVCRIRRRGYEATETGFSVADAKAANLWGKDGPWRQYPWRMLRMRARGFGLRDQFGDALRGLRSAEEAQDLPPEPTTPAVRILTEPQQLPAPATTEPEQAAETKAPTETAKPAEASRVAIFRAWLAQENITEDVAMGEIHRMFPETDALGNLDEVEQVRPQIINALSRPASKAALLKAIGGAK